MLDLTLHLHVGMNKTGSTAIQKTLAAAELGRIAYLMPELPNHAPVFAAMFEATPETYPEFSRRNLTAAEVQGMAADYSAQIRGVMDPIAAGGRQDGVFLSSERIAMPDALIDAGTIARLRAFYSAWCGRFRIYGYVRPPVSFMASSFQQWIRMHTPEGLSLDRYWPSYRSRFAKFDTVFGPAAVSLRKFDRAGLAGGDTALDIAAQIGIPLDPGQVRRFNERLSLEAIALLYAIRRTGRFPNRTAPEAASSRRLMRRLSGLGARRLRFASRLTDPLLERHAADIAWMETRLGCDLAEPPVTAADAIGSEADLLAHAAAARDLLDTLPPLDGDADGLLSPSGLRALVEEGLAGGGRGG